ncbi:metallophosphoesterase [Pontixanthobacter aquaemixtae]|uniref:Calcineurin-like phosphoesterase domain-containing protein n=1 Tax=Pontixanthobacter aquaemixtae TaxID=1958940 RepID=A0A844ZSR7_9SPHN|nr:metallophosphoesterase [Pontixanthobacter aquaemixtae]MXO90768.1 hypothetical protein [Pontixanthobacter aquaemixtae]
MAGIGKFFGGIALAAASLAAACADTSGDPTGSDDTAKVERLATLSPATHGKFLHISDIHFDPFHNDKHLVVQDLPVDQWEQHFDGSASPSSGRHNDSNFALMKSALTEAAKTPGYDFVLYTGDYLSHDFREHAEAKRWVRHPVSKGVKDPIAFAAKTVEFVNLMIEQAFPGKPIVSALGNNDAGCGDYNLRVGGEFLKDIGPEMPTLPQPAKKDFVNSGFYTIDHPTVAGTEFLVLGTFWSHAYPDIGRGCGMPSDNPGDAQKTWLSNQLSTGSGNAILLMHIPPGIDGYGGTAQWQSGFQTAFEAILSKSKRPVLGAFAGHTHMNEIRVFSNSSGPYLSVRVAPSVTTYNGNAPSFTVADYDTATGAMTDYQVYTLRYDSKSGTDAWQAEAKYSASYGAPDFSPAEVQKIANNLQLTNDSTGMRTIYRTQYSGKGQEGARCNWQNAVCAVSFTDPVKFGQCVSRIEKVHPVPGNC